MLSSDTHNSPHVDTHLQICIGNPFQCHLVKADNDRQRFCLKPFSKHFGSPSVPETKLSGKLIDQLFSPISLRLWVINDYQPGRVKTQTLFWSKSKCIFSSSCLSWSTAGADWEGSSLRWDANRELWRDSSPSVGDTDVLERNGFTHPVRAVSLINHTCC